MEIDSDSESDSGAGANPNPNPTSDAAIPTNYAEFEKLFQPWETKIVGLLDQLKNINWKPPPPGRFFFCFCFCFLCLEKEKEKVLDG
jgi:hypothetical protein